MDKIISSIHKGSSEFKENRDYNLNLLKIFKERIGKVKNAGSKRAVELHRSRNKLLPRERIDRIMDEGSPFLELSTLAAYEMYDVDVPSAGIVTSFEPF